MFPTTFTSAITLVVFWGEKHNQNRNPSFQLKLESVQNSQVLSIPRTLLAF